jgi:hypothetical protein
LASDRLRRLNEVFDDQFEDLFFPCHSFPRF